ncbi:hypothetical protein HYV85_04325 [Candidatus Woesearchaeota archaeon]|nr:hypothetical protein [Candidatus Woesearchaeota archaeon]
MVVETQVGQRTSGGVVDLESRLLKLVPEAAPLFRNMPIVAGEVEFNVPAYHPDTPLVRWVWESPKQVFINAGCVIGNGHSTGPKNLTFTYVTMAFERGTGEFLYAVYP